jgi:hypothetical protein
VNLAMYLEIYNLVQKKTRIVGCLLVLFASACVWADGTPDVPLVHPIYAVLDRFAARGQIRMPNMRPLSRMQIADRLKDVLGAESVLSQTERGVLDRYGAEFAWELEVLGHDKRAQTGWLQGDPFWTWRDSVVAVVVDPFFRQQVIAHRGDGFVSETVSQTYIGGILRGQFHGLGFRLRHFEAREWSTEQRQKQADVLASPVESVQLKGQSTDFREGVFQLAWGNGWLRLDVGKGAVDWGPGRTGNLLLTNHAPTYGMFRLQTGYKKVRYTHLAGSLQAREGLYDTTRRVVDNDHVRIFLRKKRLAAHRLEVDFSKVTVGVHESVIYGDRGFEPLYVMPVTFFVAVQNHLENRDNLAMGIDASWRPAYGVELYGAWFFDDLAKLSPSAFSNKFGLQAGLFWVDPLGVNDVDVRAEYVRLEPFVYSHNFAINTYENYAALLGHSLGPNADLWHLKVTHRLSASMTLSALFERERQGENFTETDGTLVNVGGDAQLGRRPSDPTVRRFMTGDVELRTRLGLQMRVEPIRDWAIQAAYRRIQGSQVPVLSGGRGDTVGHEWTATVDVNFY